MPRKSFRKALNEALKEALSQSNDASEVQESIDIIRDLYIDDINEFGYQFD